MPEEKIEDENNAEKEAQDEESELEEQVDKIEEEINDNQFQEFLKPSSEDFSPVLEKIADAPELVNLEQDVSSSTFTENKKEEDTKYDEVNYETVREELRKNENLLVKQFAPIRIENAGKDLHPQLRDMTFVNPELHELKRTEKNLETDYVPKAERLDTDERLPFQQTERKYKGRPI